MFWVFRRSRPLIALLFVLASGPCLFAGKEFLAGPHEQAVPGQLLVGLQPGADITQILNALAPQAIASVLSGARNTYLLTLPPGIQATVSHLLAAHPLVNYVEPNRVRGITVLPPNDPSLSSQWNLTTIQALQAWSYFPDGYLTAATASVNRVKVGILDTGVDCTHPDFINAGGVSTNSAQGGQLDWTDSLAIASTTINSPACPWEDDNGHGTHTAGLLAAATGNATGVASLGFPLQLIVIKTNSYTGSATDLTVAQGIYDALDGGAQVISMSLGGDGYSQTLQLAMDAAWESNVLVIAAAGNDGANHLEYPGGGNHVLGVAATDDTNTVASFSTYGNWVKIAAPGVNILSTVPSYGSSDGTNYASLSGTSMSTPQVAALAGLLYAANPGISAASVAQRIQQTAQQPPAYSNTGWNEHLGYGIIDAGAALGNIPGPFTQGSFTGQVVSPSGNPITGVVLTAGSQSYTTIDDPYTGDIDGLFRIANLNPGTYNITASASGYSTVNMQGVIVAGADTMLTIVMGVSSGEFSGVVTYNGVGVEGAVVAAICTAPASPACASPPVTPPAIPIGLIAGTAITNASGSYTLFLQPGTFTLTASAPNYIDAASASETLTASGNVTVNLPLSTLGVIIGTVTDINGLPVANAHIDFTSGSFSGGATTGSSGTYSTYGLPSGTYTVTASASGYASVSVGGVSVTASTSTVVNLQFSTGISLTTGLLGHWPFNEGSGNVAFDQSGNGYNAALSNTTWGAGLFTYALDFNGSNSRATTPAIPFTVGASVSVWVNPAVSTQGAYTGLAESDSNTGFYLGTDSTGTKYQVIVNSESGGTGTCGSQYGCAQGGAVTSGWHMVTGTYDGASTLLYVDGVLVASDTATGMAPGSFPMAFGGTWYSSTVWNGAMDEMRLYSRALTASEVSSLFNMTTNLTLSKTADAAAVAAGNPIGYTLSVSNSGAGTATSAALNDVLPTGTGIAWSISPAYSGPGTCAIAGGTLGCNFGSLLPSGTASVHISSATSAASCGVYANTATASASDAISVHSSATATVTCSQTISFAALSNQVFGTAPFPVSATATSGLTVSFNSQTGSVCTVAGSTVTLVAGGTCTVQATQAGNAVYSAATPVNQSFQVTPASQTITFGPLANQVYGTAPFGVSATASSGQPVSFNSQTGSVCTVTGNTVTLVSGGTCTIQATQGGTVSYSAAAPVNQSFQVTPASQTITFGPLSNQVYGTAPFGVSATASSGQPVSFNSQTGSVCTVTGSTVTLVTGGTCTIQATQGGTVSYSAATPVNQSFQVTPASQTITFGALTNQVYGTAPFGVSATASSGLTVSFNSQTGSICTVTGSTVTLVAGGTCTIQATQGGTVSYSAATPVNQSFQVTPASQTITFGPLANQVYGTGPFGVSATASSGQTVSFNSQTGSVCTVTGATVTLVAGGTCTIQATQGGTASYSAATPVNQSFQVTPASQTITFGPLTNQVYGTAPFGLSATASSGLTVSFNSQTGSICTVTGSSVTLAAGGTCTIQATQGGTASYSAATPVNQSFQVTPASQSITFGPLTNKVYGTAPFGVSATASSGMTVTLTSQTGSVCTVTGNTITLVAGGMCTIQATQGGNANYSAAAPVNQSFQVTPASQTITFGPLSNQVYGTAPFGISATVSSGLTVSFNSQTGSVCTVTGSTVTLVAGGMCTIQATQGGSASYSAATPVNQSFQVTPASQTITFGSLSNQVYGTAPFGVSATASSGLPVSFNSQTGSVCTVTGSTVTLLAGGTCAIQATQAGTASYSAATPVNRSFQVTPESQTIAFGSLSNQVYGTAPFGVSATASSGLTVSFNSQTGSVCSVTGSTVTLVAGGMCTIQATQGGTASYSAATPVNQSFQVTPASQTITFGPLKNQVYGTAPFGVSATASSGQPVSFSSQTGSVCTVTGTTVTLAAGGTCTIQATQGGTASYSAATPVNQSFQVTPASQTITFGSLSNQPLGTAPFPVSATASSGLTVTFISLTTSICTVSGATVTLAASGVCTIQATQPGNTSYAAAASVYQSFTVTAGIGTAGAAGLSFPNTVVGQSSTVQTTTLQNSGNTTLTITSIQPAGPDAANYRYTADATHPCLATLAAGATCTLDVAFAPQSQGSHNNAQLAITDNSGNVAGATQTIGLSGAGILLSSINISANNTSLVYNTTEQFTATGVYSDQSTATLTTQVTWASSAPGVAAIGATGLATALTAGQTNITAALSGVTSAGFQLTVLPGSPAAIAAASGAGQSAIVGTAFSGVLQALVKDGGGDPVPNASVTFTSPSNGAGAVFSNGTATYITTTNSSGIATSIAFTANATAGNYSVTASVTGVIATAGFSLTNLKAPVLSISEAQVGTFMQGQSGSYTLTVSNAANAGPTSGTVTVTETVPAGLTLTGLSGGTTWSCSVTNAFCTTNVVLNPGSSYPAITVTVAVAYGAPVSLANQAGVSGGAATAAGASAPTVILSACAVTLDSSPSVADIQQIINEALGISHPANDLNGDGAVNIVDLQIVVNAVLNKGCSAS